MRLTREGRSKPIFKTDEELAADLDRLLDSDEPLAPEEFDRFMGG